MEESIFRKPAVAGLLRDEFVEARLHMDNDPPFARNEEVRRELGATRATPTYAVVEPMSGGKVVLHEGPMLDPERFAAWLEQAAQRARERTARLER